MTMIGMKHWQDPVNALIGAWLLASPWLLGFQGNSPALSNSLIIGMALIAAAAGAMWLPQAWEEWTEVALGAWLLAAPWLFGFNVLQAATINSVLTGLLTIALSLWVLATDKDFGLARDRAA
jgi:hypothetical protein